MAESEEIERAGRALIEATSAPAKVILFGLHVGGDGTIRGDYELLVIEREVEDRFGERARLGKVLGRLSIPARVVVASEEEVRRNESVVGTTIHEALNHGRVIAES
jgi:predicted nucleotidyltransferase